MATYSYNGPERTTPSGQVADTGSGKSRIYQVFKSTIQLDELSLASQPGPENEKVETIQSLIYPLVKINDYFLSPSEIISLEIDSTGFIPEIKLKCMFIHQTFLTKEMPKDGDIISVAIRNKSDLLKIIRNDYVITGVTSATNTTQMVGPVTLTFFGTLFIPWLSSSQFNFSYEGTSFETLKELAKTLGLGFATNEDNTNDKQVWFSGFTYLSEFIANTTFHAYKDDKSFYDSWIDVYYNLNFINVNNQLMSSEDSVDTAAWINNIDKDYTWGDDTNEDKVIETPKVFSNYETYRTTSFYINTWRPINKSTNITFQVGTGIETNLFEHNEKLYKNDQAQKFWSIPLDPVYDPDKVKKYILLRGRATQNPEMKGNDLAKANYSYPEIYRKSTFGGIQYTISNPEDDNLQWDGNHHKNYILANIQNLINNKELEKLNVVISVNGMNTNIIKGDKTPIVLIKKDPVENRMVSPESGDLDILEQFYSGWFYVSGFIIKYSQANGESIMSNFTQDFVLTRREWPPPIAVDGLPENENNV